MENLEMSEENLTEHLSDEVEQSYAQAKKQALVAKLLERPNLTFDQIIKIFDHPKLGDVIKILTIQDLIDAATAEDDEDDEPVAAPTNGVKKRGRPPGSGKGAKKEPKAAPKKAPKAAKPEKKGKEAKKAPKAPKAAKPEKKGKEAKAAAADGKADKGKPKPRLNYEHGCKEVFAAIKAAGKPVGRGEIEAATGFPGVQVRTFCKKLEGDGKIEVVGSGGRSTKYQPA